MVQTQTLRLMFHLDKVDGRFSRCLFVHVNTVHLIGLLTATAKLMKV